MMLLRTRARPWSWAVAVHWGAVTALTVPVNAIPLLIADAVVASVAGALGVPGGWEVLAVAVAVAGSLGMSLAYKHLQSRGGLLGYLAGAAAPLGLIGWIAGAGVAGATVAGMLVTQVLVWQICRIALGRPVFREDSLCLYCDYDLTGNESGTCPECGQAVGDASA